MSNRRGVFRGTLKSLFNVYAWMGMDDLKRSGRSLKQLLKEIMTIQQTRHEETFEEAVKRFDLTEEDIQKRKSTFFWTSVCYLGVLGLLLAYMVYLAFVGTVISVLMSGVLVMVVAALAFRQHFWYFQVCERRLGCTPREWVYFLIGKKIN